MEVYSSSLGRKWQSQQTLCIVASFPGSPLAPTKNKNGGGEPGTDSHVISRHVDVTAIITKVVTQLCSHVIGWLEQLRYTIQVSCDCVGETSARVKQQWRRRSTQYVGKLCLFILLPCSALKKIATRLWRKTLVWLALHSGVQNKLTTTF